MLFKSKNCSKCNSTYDVVEDTCPVCHAHNDDFELLKINPNIVWLPVYKQILMFVIGFLVLNGISLICELTFFSFFEEGDPAYPLIVNMIRYIGVSGLMAITLIHSYPKLKSSFTKVVPYLAGLGAGFILIGINIAYSQIIALFIERTPNDNQQIANALVTTYPLLSILLLGFIGPVVEEFTYRVGMFSLLSRVHRAVAYAVTIIVFAFIHFNFKATGSDMINELINLPIYMISGGALCVLYDFLGLSSSLTAHIVNNVISTLPIIISSILK